MDNPPDLLTAMKNASGQICARLEEYLQQELDRLNVQVGGTAYEIKSETIPISYLTARQQLSGDTINVDPELRRMIEVTCQRLVKKWKIQAVEEAHVESAVDVAKVQFTLTVSLWISKRLARTSRK